MLSDNTEQASDDDLCAISFVISRRVREHRMSMFTSDHVACASLILRETEPGHIPSCDVVDD